MRRRSEEQKDRLMTKVVLFATVALIIYAVLSAPDATGRRACVEFDVREHSIRCLRYADK